jgi:Tfp pilus assembly ATPase PilU
MRNAPGGEPAVTSMMTWLEALVAAKGSDLHLIALYRDGVIELEDALGVTSSPHDLQVALRNQGLVA